MARPKKKRTPNARRPKHRASWSGQLRFGLVTFPVQAFNAHLPERGEVHFHQLHAECHKRIHYQKVCPVHGEVDKDEIVSGYEYRTGQYVEIEPDELDALRSSAERALTIDAFIGLEVINLMDALRKSLARGDSKARPAKTRSHRGKKSRRRA